MLGDDRGRTLQTTQTSLRIIELVSDRNGLTLAELTDVVDQSKSTLHAHLRTLVKSRFLIERDGTYEIALHPFAVYESARHRRHAYHVAKNKVERLAEISGEEVNFTVIEQGRLIMVHTAIANSSGEHTLKFRREYYMHNTAAGKAILAELPQKRVDNILDEWGLPRETDATITTRPALFEELESTEARGYGVVNEEFTEGLIAAGTAIRDAEDDIVGGLTVGGPKYRLDEGRVHDELAADLLTVASELESELS